MNGTDFLAIATISLSIWVFASWLIIIKLQEDVEDLKNKLNDKKSNMP